MSVLVQTAQRDVSSRMESVRQHGDRHSELIPSHTMGEREVLLIIKYRGLLGEHPCSSVSFLPRDPIAFPQPSQGRVPVASQASLGEAN